nr:hypothetical protein [Chromobacterium sp. ASV5]
MPSIRPIARACLIALPAVLAGYAHADLTRLDGSRYQIEIDSQNGKLASLTLRNPAQGDQIRAEKLFALKRESGQEISSADFTLDSVVRQGDAITLKFSNADFLAEGVITLRDKDRYASLDVSVAPARGTQRLASLSILPFRSKAPFVYGAVVSSPIVSDSFFIAPENPLTQTRAYEGGVSQTVPLGLPLEAGKPLRYRSYIGVFDEGQLRRDFGAFLNAARPRPYQPYLHYNSWLDIGFFTHYTEADALKRIGQIGDQLTAKRGVKLDGFLFDDGWDSRKGNWEFSANFPRQFLPLKDAAARYQARLGVWLSPWGGYNKPLAERVSHAGEFGYETMDGKFALSGPVYYRNFRAKVLDMIGRQNIEMFKLDGTGNASRLVPGSAFTSDFDAAIHLLADMRKANPGLFINLTTGTQATPSWLFYADSIWRDGDDINFYGKGSSVQQWITYRDAETYRSIVSKGPLFPLNSLMLHGLVYAQHAKGLEKQSRQDFADQAWSYFATGTQLQELYITPELLSRDDWDLLARAAKWARDNQKVLIDSHWIGRDPTKLEVYGWAAWSPEKSIITLRNPSDRPQSYYLDAAHDLELPQGAARDFAVDVAYGANASVPKRLAKPATLTLRPLETLTLSLVPQR